MRVLTSYLIMFLVSFSAVAEDTAILDPLLRHTSADPSGVYDVLNRAGEVEPRQAPAPTGEVIDVDADECVRRALAHSPKGHSGEEDVAIRAAQTEQARARKRPTIGLTATGLYLSDTGGGIPTTPLSRLVVGTDVLGVSDTVAIGQLSVQQILYAGGTLRRAVEASEFLEQSAEWQHRATLAEVALDTRRAYYDGLLSQALVQVARESVDTHTRHLADADHALEVGALSKFEVLRARTSLAASESELASAQSLAEIALLNLKRLTGVDQTADLRLIGSLEWTPLDNAVDDLVAEARAQRPEVNALQQAIEAADKQVAARQGQFRPTVGLNVAVQHMEGVPDLIPQGVIVGVVGQWDLYAGGRRKYEVVEAEAQARQLRHQLIEVNELIDLDVRRAFTQLHEAIAKIRKEKVTVASGQEGLALSELRFREGIGIQAETLDAELALTQARTALVRALRDYAVAAAALDTAVGRALNDFMPPDE